MTKQHLSAELKQFIKEQIQTAPKLEVLLLLHRHGSRSLAVAQIAKELGFEIETAKDQLTALEILGHVESNSDQSKYRYNPVSVDLDSMVHQLAAAYSKQRVPILSAILGEDPDKIRRFVEAFKLARSND